jgi:hypothetical protein
VTAPTQQPTNLFADVIEKNLIFDPDLENLATIKTPLKGKWRGSLDLYLRLNFTRKRV